MTGGAGALAAFVTGWGRALRRVSYVPMLPDERTAFLTGLTGRLVRALTAPDFDPSPGYWVGADLAAAGFAAPEALGRTLTHVTTGLPAVASTNWPAPAPTGDSLLPAAAPAAAPVDGGRLTALVEALAAGFAAAVHERSLDAQESIRLAALTARDRAERELRDSQARFRHLATHDPLTGLPNRTALAELLDAAGTARVGLCCIDLDRFAGVNDSLGHHVGDRLLCAAADRLRALVAGAGHPIVRLDGDQFAILVAGTGGPEDAVKIVDRALAVLAEPFHVDGTEVPLTASAGVVERPAAGAEAAELIRAAHIALHWAKADGRARWRLFEDRRSAADAARYRLSAAIPAALRRGEFTLAYQPLVGLHDGRLVGAEALARWHHPTAGLLGAARFIGLAQDTGLIVPLGDHLLELACRQAATWRAPEGRPAPYVNVNLAAAQLHRESLAGLVAQVLDRTGLDPRRLHLEITEHVFLEPTGVVLANLHALCALGVRVVVDDFGTGYSNLACLRTLPLHGLKLAAALVGPTPQTPTDRAFLATVVLLGHTLGLTVTAEGIETAAQADRMREAGCDVGQGYHFGRPVTAHRIAHHITTGTPAPI